MDSNNHGIDDSVMSNSTDPLSSPPGSPEMLPTSGFINPPHSGVDARSHPFSGVAPPTHHSVTSAPNLSGNSTTTAPVPKKPGRKKKEVDPEKAAAAAAKALKEPKKPGRKPRPPKDPNAPPTQRKRPKTEASQAALLTTIPPMNAPMSNVAPVSNGSVPLRQPAKIADLVSNIPVNAHQPQILSPSYPRPQLSQAPATPTLHQSRPASSGQMFDPIRGSTIIAPPISPTPHPLNRASASPSIKSLIDPNPPTNQFTRMPSSSLSGPQLIKNARNPYQPSPPSAMLSNSNGVPLNLVPTGSSARTKDVEEIKLKRMEIGSVPSSAAPTPPPKSKFREPPPLPTGTGLLSGTPWGGISTPGEGGAEPSKGVNIWLSFDLKGKENVTINFAHEVEKKYGLAALNPRLAARKERQRQVALASSELEKAAGLAGSADDMSLDGSEPESNNDTDVVMKEADGEVPVKRRKRKAEDYDRNDGFIDDTEQLLEEQALMAKDGFFVYSGPLIEEGERPAVERADGTVRRGRGRGRGGSTRGETSGRGSRGGGRGSRGGTTVRKPRVTKADRAMMEQEKLQREKMAANLAATTKPPAPVAVPTPTAV